MGVIWVRKKPGGESGGQDERGSSSFHTEYTVQCDTSDMTRLGVLGCGLLPVIGSPHPELMTAICHKTDAKRNKDDPLKWEAEANWQESPRSRRDPNDDQKNPDQRRPKWKSRFVPYSLARFVDYDGMLLADAADTPFDPPPDMPIYVEEISIFRYEATAGRSKKRSFMGTSNGDCWMGANVGEALIDDISVEDEYIKGQWWWPTTYRILIKPCFKIPLPGGGTTYVGGFNPEYVLNAGPLAWSQDAKTGLWSKRPVEHGGFHDGRPAFLTPKQTGLISGTYWGGEEIKPDPTTRAMPDPNFLSFKTKNISTFGDLDLVPPDGWEN